MFLILSDNRLIRMLGQVTVGVVCVLALYVRSEAPDLDMGTCLTLDPFESALPQTTPFPFELLSNKVGDMHNQNSVIFQIKSKDRLTEFERFLVQARCNSTGVAVGTFVDTGDADIELVNCFGHFENTAREFDKEPKREVRMRWMPEFDYEGFVTFYVTVVQTKDIFWLMEPANTLRIYNPW